jgi:acyl carrier protein
VRLAAEIVESSLTPLELIADEMDAPVTEEMSLDVIDSLEYIELIRRSEVFYGIRIEEEDLEEAETLGDFCRVIDALRARQKS